MLRVATGPKGLLLLSPDHLPVGGLLALGSPRP
jgi:hypothetical protein